MLMSWKLQDAKNRLSEVVSKADSEGPQVITVRGKETAVVISVKTYRALSRQKTSLLKFFQSSPLFGEDISFERDKSVGREIDL